MSRTFLLPHWKKPTVPITLYDIPFKKPPTSVLEALNNPPFILKFVQRLEGGELNREGTLPSSSLPALKGGQIPLDDIRPRIAAMFLAFTRHQFCLQDGHLVDDTILLKDYLVSSTKTIDQTEQIPSIEVYFVNRASTPQALQTGALSVERDKTLLEMKEQLDAAKYRVSEFAVKDAKSAGKLTEDEWGLVIRNCNLMFGWVVDVDNNTVKRAPKAAFRLKKGLNMPVGYVPSVNPPTTTSVTTTNVTTTTVATSVPATGTTTTPTTTPATGTTGVPPATTTVPGTVVVPTTGVPVTTSTTVPGTGVPTTTPAVPMVTTSTSQSTTTTLTTNVRLPEKANAIPNFTVTDESRIEITVVGHQFQESMAKSYFNSTSVEASV